MTEFTKSRFNQVNDSGCVDTTCGRSVIVNEDPCPDCCGGGNGTQGPAGPAGPPGPPGLNGRSPIVGCGCLGTNPTDGGSGSPIQQQCIDNLKGRVVLSSTNINYYGQTTTSNNFFQVNCSPTCGYFNVTNPSQQQPALGNFTGNLGAPSTIVTGDKNIVAWGYLGTGSVPNRNYTWTYGDFKKLNGLSADKLTASQAQQSKFTFIPTDSLFADGGSINLAEFKNLVQGTPSEELTAAFLNDFPECATDGTGTPPGPKNGQGADICGSIGGECQCEGCSPENAFPNCDDLQAGDIFVDACNKIMYIAGEGGFPANGIPFGPEDRPCPPEEPCPDCPDCPEPEPCGTCLVPKNGEALQPAAWCNCASALGQLYNLIGNTGCVCQNGGALPKCPQPCKKSDGTLFPNRFYYQDPKRECPCNDDGDEAKCPNQCPSDPKSDWYQNATKECPCAAGKTYVGCQDNCPGSGKDATSRICPEDCCKTGNCTPANGCDTCITDGCTCEDPDLQAKIAPCCPQCDCTAFIAQGGNPCDCVKQAGLTCEACGGGGSGPDYTDCPALYKAYLWEACYHDDGINMTAFIMPYVYGGNSTTGRCQVIEGICGGGCPCNNHGGSVEDGFCYQAPIANCINGTGQCDNNFCGDCFGPEGSSPLCPECSTCQITNYDWPIIIRGTIESVSATLLQNYDAVVVQGCFNCDGSFHEPIIVGPL